MFKFLKSRTFLIIVGFVLLAVFIWFAGPYFAFADFHPLESAAARLILIAFVIACWFLVGLIRWIRASRVSDKLVSAVLSQSQGPAAQVSPEAAKLRERFEEGVATLKQRRRRGHTLYDLPWYVIIGAPGSGKTTALVNSGLKFPLEHRVGKGALRGVGGTRNCDWWFTEEAVFLDTAGRYTTQDSDTTSDSVGWHEFLTLLRKYRKRRPVNGVILTISAQDLMVQGEMGREAHVDAVRRRLRELNQELQIQLPVYLMVTKCDLIAGFTEYFEDLTQDGRAQVWGVTFPYEQTQNGEAAQNFPAEFDALMTRLNSRVFARLEEERDARRRTGIFGFPQQVAALRDFLVQFVTEITETPRSERQCLLRGVYFSSGTQEGTPIDRLLGSIGRRFGVAADAVVAPTGKGKAFFVERLLKDVMIGESGLAGVNRRGELRKAVIQLSLYAALVLIALVGVLALTISHGRNRTYLEEVGAEVNKLREVPAVHVGSPLPVLLPRLNAARTVVDSADRYREGTPWSMRWGLYQGTSMGKSARDAYSRELDGLVLPVFAARVKERLSQYSAQPDKLYEYLKAYLMLGDPAHFDRTFLRYVADQEWSASSRVAANSASLSEHFQNWLDYANPPRPIVLDASLVAQARSTIRQASIPRIMYGEIARSYAADSRVVHLEVAGGIGTEQVLQRKSGTRLSDPIASLYGREVFKEATGTKMPGLVKQFIADSWVWGEGGIAEINPLQLAADATAVYEREYMGAWDAILDDLELAPFTSAAQMAAALGALAAPTSPLRGVLRVVIDNTTLIDLRENAPTGALASAKTKLTDSLGRVLKSVQDATGTSTQAPGSLVTAHFQEIQRLMAGAPGMTPLDAILNQFAQIQAQLTSLGADLGRTDPLDALNNPVFRTTLQTLQKDAAGLPPRVAVIVSQIGNKAEASVIRGASSDLRARYDRQVLRVCNEVVAGRYPFVANSQMEITLADFARVFGTGGVYDRFFTENLQTMVDQGSSPWTWRPGSATLSGGFLTQFELAQLVRDSFFPQGAQVPQLNFNVKLADLENSDRRFILQLDGQIFDNKHGFQRPWAAKWPASDPGYAAVTFEDRAGAWPTDTKFVGTWAWLHLIESGDPRREPPLHTVMTFRQGEYRSSVTIEATSVRNPFADQSWRQFRCGQ